MRDTIGVENYLAGQPQGLLQGPRYGLLHHNTELFHDGWLKADHAFFLIFSFVIVVPFVTALTSVIVVPFVDMAGVFLRRVVMSGVIVTLCPRRRHGQPCCDSQHGSHSQAIANLHKKVGGGAIH
jgi:hypothetical protein